MSKVFEASPPRYHSKASEKYVDVKFFFGESTFLKTSVPIEYRRTGTEVPDEEIEGYLREVWAEVEPSKWDSWRAEQVKFWESKDAQTTQEFFEILAKSFNWCCVSCTLPKNSNPARRIQAIKEFGYTLATDTTRFCATCKRNTTQLILLPIKRGGISGYENWSPKLRSRIMRLLGSFDAFEAKEVAKEGLLPDHKFPEIRWDLDTKRDSLEELTDADIKRDFQLLSNQRNQQKREVCRSCFQTGKRGTAYGIEFFYAGTAKWDLSYPQRGKAAEGGCIGCAWYDFDRWRKELTAHIKSQQGK